MFPLVTTTLLFYLVIWNCPASTNGFFLNFKFLQTAMTAFGQRTSRAAGVSETDHVKCFGELGCLETGEEWYDLINRPLNLRPYDRQKINTRFILYTRQRVTDPIQVTLNSTTLTEAGFDPKKPTKFVVHGFIDTGFSSWVVKMCQQLTVVGDYNVFAVDWGGGSLPLYTQATSNTRVTGLELAHFIKFLMSELNVVPDQIHIIGHSLGAHVAGYTGERIKGLGRITGLDPAEPYFQYMPEFVRLDPSDAKFVDVIHTDGRTILLLGYGMQQPCGHMDFYPNDGREQPGCELTEIPLALIHLHGFDDVQREIFACNHHRAIYYFIDSLLNKCHYVGHRCNDYDSYLKGQCYTCGEDGSRCALMGLDADKYNIGNRSLVPFYVSTGKASPFCVRHYRVNLQLAFPQHAAAWVTGKLKMSIHGDLESIKTINLSPVEDIRIHHGTNMTFLVQSASDLGSIQNVRVDWKYHNSYLDVMAHCWTMICNNKLFVRRVEIVDIDDLQMERGKSELVKINLCGEEGTKYTRIASGTSATFERPC